MPAAEAGSELVAENKRADYELAFHILPTVAEREVQSVTDALKELVTSAEAEIIASEAPERVDLAYEINKVVAGKRRLFTSAYFGWFRFKLPSAGLDGLTESVSRHPKLLRYLLIKLTKTEVANPFYFHQSLKDEKMVTSVEESEVVPDITTASHTDILSIGKDEKKSEAEDTGEVSDEALDESLDKITGDEASVLNSETT